MQRSSHLNTYILHTRIVPKIITSICQQGWFRYLQFLILAKYIYIYIFLLKNYLSCMKTLYLSRFFLFLFLFLFFFGFCLFCFLLLKLIELAPIACNVPHLQLEWSINPASNLTLCGYVWANPNGSGGVYTTNVST